MQSRIRQLQGRIEVRPSKRRLNHSIIPCRNPKSIAPHPIYTTFHAYPICMRQVLCSRQGALNELIPQRRDYRSIKREYVAGHLPTTATVVKNWSLRTWDASDGSSPCDSVSAFISGSCSSSHRHSHCLSEHEKQGRPSFAWKPEMLGTSS